MNVEFVIPVRTVSESNLREHWATKSRRTRFQRRLATAITRENIMLIATEAVHRITLIRLAPRRLDAGNNPSAMKAVQDGVCDALKINDGDAAIDWRYQQQKSKTYGVRVKIEYGA